jgi:opacity protein-like surface antigen
MTGQRFKRFLASLVCVAGGLANPLALHAQTPEQPMVTVQQPQVKTQPPTTVEPRQAPDIFTTQGNPTVTAQPVTGGCGAGGCVTEAPQAAQAAQCCWYLSLSAGWQERQRVHEASDAGTFLTFDDGFMVNGALGVRWKSLRLEFEFSTWNNDINTAGVGGAGNGTSTAQSAALGNITLYSYMANVYYDFTLGSFPLKPYVGAGIGFYHSEINGLAPAFANGGVLLNCMSDYPFAYQFRAGVSYDVSERVELFGGYRYFHGDTLTFSAVPFGTFHPLGTENNGIEFGFRVKF